MATKKVKDAKDLDTTIWVNQGYRIANNKY